jgi:hypothetical protein
LREVPAGASGVFVELAGQLLASMGEHAAAAERGGEHPAKDPEQLLAEWVDVQEKLEELLPFA